MRDVIINHNLKLINFKGTLLCLVRKVWHILSTMACLFLPMSTMDWNMASLVSSVLSHDAPNRDSIMPAEVEDGKIRPELLWPA